MDSIPRHRREFHLLDFADGLNFWMAEDKIGRIDYYMIAKSIRDTKWLGVGSENDDKLFCPRCKFKSHVTQRCRRW